MNPDERTRDIVSEREAIEYAWLRRTRAEDVLHEMLIDHLDQLDELFEAHNFDGDPETIGRYVLAVRNALALRYAKRWGDDYGISRGL